MFFVLLPFVVGAQRRRDFFLSEVPLKNTTPQAVQAAHELLGWVIPQIDKFPRLRRFTLGERLESVLIEVLELSVEAAFTPPDGNCNPVLNVLCRGRTVVCGHNMRVRITNPYPQ